MVTHEVMVSNFREKRKGKCNFLVGEFGRTGAGQDILLSDRWRRDREMIRDLLREGINGGTSG